MVGRVSGSVSSDVGVKVSVREATSTVEVSLVCIPLPSSTVASLPSSLAEKRLVEKERVRQGRSLHPHV